MKIYIKSASKIELPVEKIEIYVNIVVNSDITASADNQQNLPIANDAERGFVADTFEGYLRTAASAIESEGFKVEKKFRSNGKKSQSAYFVFCYEDEKYIQRIQVMFTLRVSNHPVPMKPNDESQEQANARQEAYLKRMISDKEKGLGYNGFVAHAYFQYEGHYLHRFIDVIRGIQERVRQLKVDYPSSATDESDKI